MDRKWLVLSLVQLFWLHRVLSHGTMCFSSSIYLIDDSLLPVFLAISSHFNCFIHFYAFAVSFSTAEGAHVSLEHIQIYRTHDLPLWKPTVYFMCAGEEKHFLTGVTEKGVQYNFTMNESFQVCNE